MGSCFSANSKGRELDEQPKYMSARVQPSYEDRGDGWVGECDVDTKASAFIAKIHETRVVDLKSHETRVMGHERQTDAVAV